MFFARALLCLWLSVVACVAQAQEENNLIVSRSMFIEPAPGRLSIEQAISQDYQPFFGVLNRGFTPTIRWLRIQVQAPTHGTEQVVLRLGPHYISQIELFEQKDGVWTSRLAGDHYPATQNACADNLYCFPVTIRAGIQNDFYVRIDSINGYVMTTRALSAEALSRVVVSQQRMFGLELGVFLAICIWSCILYLRYRLALAGVFLIAQSTSLLFTLSSSGLLAEVFFQDHVWLDNLFFNVLYVFRLMTALWLSQSFSKAYEPQRWFGFYIKGTLGVLVLELLALKLGHITLIALNVNFLIVLTLPLFLLLAILGCRNIPKYHRYYLSLGCIALCAVLWSDIVPIFGFIKPDLVSAPGNWGGLVSAVVLSMMVFSDVTLRRSIFDRELQELQLMRARNLAEAEQIKERSMLIDMLTHEIKNPLATMRMAAGSLRRSLNRERTPESAESIERISSMVQAINNMNTVIDQCVQVDQLDQHGLIPNFQEVHVNEVIETILSRHEDVSGIDLTLQPELFLQTDPKLYSIILSNLIDNALKYSQPNSRITIEAFENTSTLADVPRCTFRISNLAAFDDVPDAESVFNRYYRGVYAHEKSGTGLGLYLVRSLCTLLGGTVRFEHQQSQIVFIVEVG